MFDGIVLTSTLFFIRLSDLLLESEQIEPNDGTQELDDRQNQLFKKIISQENLLKKKVEQLMYSSFPDMDIKIEESDGLPLQVIPFFFNINEFVAIG